MSLFINLTNWLETHQLPCLFKAITHVDCPGCGIQRSAIALLRGDLLQSLHHYPALIPLVLFFIFLVLNDKYRFSKGQLIIKTGIASIFITILVSYIIKLTI